MRIPQLVSFYHVARLSSMSKAAEQLHLGQPTVTTHLKKLEDEFGVMLFDRIKRPIQLTSDGATILELIAPIINGLTSLQAYVDDPERHGSLTIAAYSDLVLHYLPRVIQVFRAGFPEVHVRLLDRSHEEMIQMIKAGEVDLALSIAPTVSDPSMNYLELFRSSTVLLTPLDHELLGRRPVSLSDIARWPLIQYGPDSVIRGRLERELEDRGIDHETVLEMDNAEFIKRYVRIGMGVGICSGLSLEPDDRDTLGVIEIDHLLSDLTIGVYTLKGKFQGNAVRNFIAGLRETSPSH
jgi:LysR family cys regulon transcriptional activator